MAQHVCPWWLGYFLAGPWRRWSHPPEKILAPHVFRGMTVMDVGCGMGFFSLPMARMVGAEGKVVCIDLQQRMLNSLRRRASGAGLTERLDLRLCDADTLGIDDLAGRLDFVLAFAVAHEVPDIPGLFAQLRRVLRPRGTLLLAEPKGHVKSPAFSVTVSAAENAGMTVIDHPSIKRSHTALLQKS